MADATVISNRRLALEQVSALCIRRDAGGAEQLLAVGDENFALVTAPLDRGGVGDDRRHELSDVAEHVGKKSEWEAAAADGEGRVFLIEEKRATVAVLSAGLNRQVHTIHLRAGDGPDGRARELLEGKNKGPEGMLLLAGGHLLVVKQRKPVLLIEFGPRADDPLAFGSDAPLGRHAAFMLSGGGETDLFPLRSWQLLDEETVGSANDLAVDDAGQLHAISSRSCCIYALEPRDDEIVAARRWVIPDAIGADEDHHAEGLAF